MIIKNQQGLPVEHNDGDFKRFISLILENAPKYKKFKLHELKRVLNLSKREKAIFSELSRDMRVYLVENNLAKQTERLKLLLIEKENSVMIDNSITNYGDNYGIQSSSSQFEKSVNINTNYTSSNVSKQKPLVTRFFNNSWLVMIFSLLIGAVFNTKRIKDWIDMAISNF